MHDNGQADQERQSGEDLRYYVKFSSWIICMTLLVIDAIGIILFAICALLDLNMLTGVTPLGEAEGLEFFDSLLGPPLGLFVLFVLGVFILILIAESVMKLFLIIEAVSKEAYGKYQTLSVFSLAEMVVNSILVFVGVCIAVNLEGIYSAEKAAIEEGVMIWLRVYAFLGILTISDMIFATILVDKEKAKRA